MRDNWQFTSVSHGVGRCHIPMKCPRVGNEVRKKHYNFKKFYSIVTIGIVGTDVKFLLISIGLPDSLNVTYTFQDFRLYQNRGL